MKIVAMSDTHGLHWDVDNIPDGDIFIFAGDMMNAGHVDDLLTFNVFLDTLPHKHKIVIAGNHDGCLDGNPTTREMITNAIYLQDQEIVIEGIKIYGAPWTPTFLNWHFMAERGNEIKAYWDMIPDDTDILVTHGPPYKTGDVTGRGEAIGCWDLAEAVKRIKPKYHVFGHNHFGYGIYQGSHTAFMNVSVCTEDYDPVNPPIKFEM